MRFARMGVALGAGAVSVLLATLARGEPVHASYRAPDECPVASSFFEEVASRTPRFELARARQPARSFGVLVTVDEGGSRGALTIREVDGREAKREVTASDCGEVVSALALITAIAIDPDADTSLRVRTSVARALPPSTPVPSLSKDSNPKPIVLIEPRARFRVALGAGASLSTAISPSTAAGAQLFVELRRDTLHAMAPSVRVSLLYLQAPDVVTSIGTAGIAWVAARLEGCPLTWKLPPSTKVGLAVAPCAGLDVGSLRGAGRDTVDPSAAARPWLAGLVAARVELTLFDAWFLDLGAGVTVPFRRYEFAFEPSTKVFTVPVAGAIGGIAAGFRFP